MQVQPAIRPRVNYMSTHQVGVVIPALNEEGYLPHVLDVVCSVGWLTQIVVVDDGSKDNTLVQLGLNAPVVSVVSCPTA